MKFWIATYTDTFPSYSPLGAVRKARRIWKSKYPQYFDMQLVRSWSAVPVCCLDKRAKRNSELWRVTVDFYANVKETRNV